MQLSWDIGTAYDFFVSIDVLHEPKVFGVRSAWAAGVRARLSSDERAALEQGQAALHGPLPWIHSLPEPKDASVVLGALAQIEPAERLSALAFSPKHDTAALEAFLRDIAGRRQWEPDDIERYMDLCGACEETMPDRKKIETILDAWAHAGEFGEGYLSALQTYYQVFFAEEEARIAPAQQQALARAQDLAQRLAVPDLLEALSEGLHFGDTLQLEALVLAPSFWVAPLMYLAHLAPKHGLFLYGARPADASLVPGEVVPDLMLRRLKALSDPTRLRILHDLSAVPLSPAELARRLRLRAPTVTHHLKALRLAGLVQILLDEGGESRRYAARGEAVADAFAALQSFLGTSETGLPTDGDPR